jgi:integral membrane protein
MILMQSLRAVSLTEGVSYLLLLLVAMPLKYVWGLPLAVKWVGWAHGVLFMALGVLLLLAMLRAALPFKLALIVGVAALLPAGPFFADRLLRRHQESLLVRVRADG